MSNLGHRMRRAAGIPPSRVYTDQAVDTSSQTTYTFTSRSIGTAAANRRILVAASGRDSGGGSPSVTGITVGGISGTELVEATEGSANFVAFYLAAVPTGTTATIVVTTTGGEPDRCGIGVWALYDLASDTPTATATDTTDGEPMNVSLNVAAGGMAFGSGFAANTPSHTWTGLTEDFEAVLEADLVYSGASAQDLSAASPRTITLGMSPTSALRVAAAVSLR